MFCASLRKRPLWRIVGPVLASTGSPKLRETKLGTHDFQLPLNVRGTGSQRILHVLLLTPASVRDAVKDDTVTRLERFIALAIESDLVIALLLSEEKATGSKSQKADMMPLLLLQKLMLEHLPISLPVIPIQHPELLVPALQSHLKETSREIQQTFSCAPADLVPYCTATDPYRPLDQHTVNILSDLFPTVRDLCLGVRTDTGRRLLREYFDPQAVQGILSFWAGSSNDI
ncbi:hypothetical protein D8B26_004787 [Coccidioides posadasii str. Silveira]|uniref:uncharacterized protein n=1 Tax=Coccidioides posadasii (strain RMSCC 757 / Silveira) TaxID=443226 RepID=UPI001BF16466|nr:hypothetical protein D8B26_004787 [Coccidioides posadasii str. Silveira]